MKAIEQYFHVVLFVILNKVVHFKSVDETVVCDHSNNNKSYLVQYVYVTSCPKSVVYFSMNVEGAMSRYFKSFLRTAKSPLN